MILTLWFLLSAFALCTHEMMDESLRTKFFDFCFLWSGKDFLLPLVNIVVTVSFGHRTGSKANCLNDHICFIEDRTYMELEMIVYILDIAIL